MSTTGTGPRFQSHDRHDGIEIRDPIENARFALYTPEPVEPEVADTGSFSTPVDAAVVVHTSAVEVPRLGNVIVRSRDGAVLSDGAAGEDRRLPAGRYVLELSTAPMKLYLDVEAALHVRHGPDSVVVSFDREAAVRIGARSFHERPAGTVTTPDDPESVMRAVSLLGSSLKTTSSERSFPTLRGFPPLLRRGETFSAPPGIRRPDTGVELVLPATLSAVYTAAPLAFYLGAEVVPGDEPRLEADGVEHPLDGPDGFERTVHRSLQRVFFMDSLVRTEGRYHVRLHERDLVEPRLDLDIADVYGRPLSAQLAAYFDVPFEAIADALPDWNLTVDVRPAARYVEALPYLVADLALVRCPERPTNASVKPQPKALSDFYRRSDGRSPDDLPLDGLSPDGRPPDDQSPDGRPPAAPDGGVAVRSSGDAADGMTDVFRPEPAETLEHAWLGEGSPIGANKLTVGALRQGLEWSPAEDAPVSVRVVCNDEAMQAEGEVAGCYGLRLRDLLEFDVDIEYDLRVAELAELLERDVDFLHYVGHVDAAGFRCADGYLDARSLDSVGVRAFLLNACTSYRQGEALVDAGSLGGVVTLSDVPNGIATDLGWPLARLLNCGFSLRTALSVAKREVLTASRYVTIGDGGVTLCQSESGAPTLLRVERAGGDAFAVEFVKYPTRLYGMGSMHSPNLPGVDRRFLGPGTLDSVEVAADELERCLNLQILPVEVDGELRWSDEVRIEEL